MENANYAGLINARAHCDSRRCVFLHRFHRFPRRSVFSEKNNINRLVRATVESGIKLSGLDGNSTVELICFPYNAAANSSLIILRVCVEKCFARQHEFDRRGTFEFSKWSREKRERNTPVHDLWKESVNRLFPSNCSVVLFNHLSDCYRDSRVFLHGIVATRIILE